MSVCLLFQWTEGELRVEWKVSGYNCEGSVVSGYTCGYNCKGSVVTPVVTISFQRGWAHLCLYDSKEEIRINRIAARIDKIINTWCHFDSIEFPENGTNFGSFLQFENFTKIEMLKVQRTQFTFVTINLSGNGPPFISAQQPRVYEIIERMQEGSCYYRV